MSIYRVSERNTSLLKSIKMIDGSNLVKSVCFKLVSSSQKIVLKIENIYSLVHCGEPFSVRNYFVYLTEMPSYMHFRRFLRCCSLWIDINMSLLLQSMFFDNCKASM